MRNPHGVGLIIEPDKPTWERDSITCCHCARVVWVKPGTGATVYLILHRDGRWTEEPGAWCGKCNQPVCLPCHAKDCDPIEAWLERKEKAPPLILVT